ncbi:MAG: NAD(P)/FAD-dependent oxidoreductase [Acidimicrobiia bacterium]|nr:NAD(P)/FAD-dependent oxidoreductase [Acidimicrobiia bacterium]MBT8215588.1 NAD(P)/FAD-dependent oxidoreductase [Acidimicrobiia bacterium]NNF09642.1 NAD(P)/FAD-dependent oxidoreductase [Acidimicrobiia bacterium]NNL71717.1 NAD(P)/FAD-dependent oxidoreductase [Acidimicrobiia bacterium]
MAHDAIVVGAGHNGLAAAIILAKAGWDVAVLERNAEAGGAVRTAEVTLPGFRHDLYAANLNLFAGSPFFAEFGDELAANGLEFAPSSRPFSSVFPDGGFIGVSTDLEATVASVEAFSPADGAAWRELNDWFGTIAPHLFPLLGTPLPSARAVRTLAGGARALGKEWPFELTRLVLQSTREFVEEHFSSREVQALCAAWGMHLDFPPDVAGGALFPFLETFADGANGMVLGVGGARSMIDAQVSLLESYEGSVRLEAPVQRILVEDGRATGVELADGERIMAGRAVIANLTPKVLFDRLVPAEYLPARFRRRVEAYRHAPGTMMVHLAMDDLPDWAADPAARDYAYVHIGPYMEDMGLAYQHAVAGLLPTQPMLVVGQPTAVDPTRAPDGKHVLWVQVRVVPGTITGDAAGAITASDWNEAKEPYADRVLDIIEQYAPGTRSKVLARHVLAPTDLEADNPNLIGGDSLGGSHHLMQHFFLRPFPGWTRYRTPVDGLFMCGAGTWPGAGVGAGSGHLLGQQLTAARPLERLKDRLGDLF